MDAAAAVATASPVIFKVAGSWFFDPISRAKAAELGIKGYPFYFGGRGGVLGDVQAPTVVAAFSFFEPGLLTKQFGTATAEHSPSAVGKAGTEACVAWGRAKFSPLGEGADRAAALGRRIVDVVPLFGHTLFTAWRGVPLPDDGPGALALTLQSLRELRGDCHIHACAAVGLTPLEAMVAQDGTERAQQFGWPEPYPDAAPLVAARTQAEELTDRQMVRYYGALSADERAEFVRLVGEIERAAATDAE